MLVLCWYLVREKQQLKICLSRIAQFYFRALLVARITLIRADSIFAQEHCAKIKLTRKFHELRYLNLMAIAAFVKLITTCNCILAQITLTFASLETFLSFFLYLFVLFCICINIYIQGCRLRSAFKRDFLI